jgi:hypothetical protein
MPGEPLRLAAVGGHDVDVRVASVVRAEGDRAAVWRKLGILGFTLQAREPARRPAGAIDDPDVAAVREGNLPVADGRGAEQAGLSRRERRQRRDGAEQGREQGGAAG